MPILEAKLLYTYEGQQMLNTFNYLASGTPAAVTFSFGLASAMGFVPAGPVFAAGTVAEAIQKVQPPSLTYTLLSVRDVYSDVDFYEVPFVTGTVGTVEGSGPAAPFLAYAYRTNRTRLDIRRGQRRFAGVLESGMDDGGEISPAFYAGQISTLATRMSESLTFVDEGQNLSFQPIIVSKEKLDPEPPEYPNVRYKYYPTETLQLQHIMTSIVWSPMPFVSTQNSRKRGRGT